ncbi:hypothetical protein HanXRQr2_Chr05g0204531 [Helianthus annuus]|uniref:Uncharacterized protein n=1 Tax=Helianthus annuus TaxID=4232 RepID=A0A9K3NLL4_HELAN|nr:hypothetical protein HanXRQr2_Chr05g0204531 [Helianthus annuus]KAJ0921907.1 hypothetical protein HanPSC8_Chr05g0197211 [Helianthus annuus]
MVFAFFLWCIWGARNDQVFNNENSMKILEEAETMSSLYGSNTGQIYSH